MLGGDDFHLKLCKARGLLERFDDKPIAICKVWYRIANNNNSPSKIVVSGWGLK